MVVGLTVLILGCYYFLAWSSGKTSPFQKAPLRDQEPMLFKLQLTFPLYFLCLAANFQAAATGASKALQGLQHFGFTAAILGFAAFAPLYAGMAEAKGEIKGTFGPLKKGDKFFTHTVQWYQRNGMICLLLGGMAALAFVTGFWAPLFVR